MAKYLVTGAAGFIGNHLVQRLAGDGHEVIAVDNKMHSNADFQLSRLSKLSNIQILDIDLSDRISVNKLPKVDGVFHLAALNGTANFYSNPWKTLWNSTVPTVLLLDHYSVSDLKFFFYAGSSEAYASSVTEFGYQVPTPEEVPLGISDPRSSRWSYGASKLHGEVACFSAQAETGIPVVVGRFHNAYGPNMGIKHVIPDFINRGKTGVFELYGAHQTRSFIYIKDAIDSVIALSENAIGEIVNIGSSYEVTMVTLAKQIMKSAGWEGEIKEFDAPIGSVDRRAPELGKLSKYVDINAFTTLEAGIELTLPSYLRG
jgi:UDP-glucose 4-epimerase